MHSVLTEGVHILVVYYIPFLTLSSPPELGQRNSTATAVPVGERSRRRRPGIARCQTRCPEMSREYEKELGVQQIRFVLMIAVIGGHQMEHNHLKEY